MAAAASSCSTRALCCPTTAEKLLDAICSVQMGDAGVLLRQAALWPTTQCGVRQRGIKTCGIALFHSLLLSPFKVSAWAELNIRLVLNLIFKNCVVLPPRPRPKEIRGFRRIKVTETKQR